MTTTAEPSTAQTPRPITARARRRAWAEPNVRLWWMSALAIGFVSLWLVSAEVIDGLSKRAKLRSGIPVVATIDTVAGKAVRTRGTPMNVRLRYTVNGVDIVDTQEKTIEATDGSEPREITVPALPAIGAAPVQVQHSGGGKEPV